ncbi:Glycogen phosphorylase 1 [Smittium mucronatum]|uniref:Alpha-1,4 glucan phosphorylase n=1 Tax=Smittium mucronatum TaxID=133383 RepID=A0A1R0H974_9FUNG|nr:Glycogen phosphorylase 1 [Smittium mucronatum]
MDRFPTQNILSSLATARITPENEVPASQPKPLKRVVSGFALKELLAGKTQQTKRSDVSNSEYAKFVSQEVPRDEVSILNSVFSHLAYTFHKNPSNTEAMDAYNGIAFTIRDRLLKRLEDTDSHFISINAKRINYMSMEFLIGRTFDNAMLALGLRKEYSAVSNTLGFNLEDLIDEERDAALGNGGLGRLAACFVDSMACCNYNGWGYGLRYRYGMFQQQIINGYQVEAPDCWMDNPNPWEFPRPEISYKVKFYGNIAKTPSTSSGYTWENAVEYDVMAFDTPVPAFGTKNVGNIRLWSCKTNDLFDLNRFNAGDYPGATGNMVAADILTYVLYPNDNQNAGKELRLKQEYMFVSATIQDIIHRFKLTGKPWSEFHELVAIQLNDTHPTLGIAELQRILVDEEAMSWDAAWDIVTKSFAFTNHTILPEALEKWPVPMMGKILPRHLGIIFDINLFFLQHVEKSIPSEREFLSRISIIEESSPQQVRMAYLAIVGSHRVNGVAQIHSDIIKATIFSEFVKVFGSDKFVNVTNGVTTRRWVNQCNPGLSALITETVGDESWVDDYPKAHLLESRVNDEDFRKRWWDVKQANKLRLATYIKDTCGITVNHDALFDIQVKRIHEYKRQLMNILGVIHRYNTLKKMTPEQRQDQVHRVIIFAGKSASGYYIAKLIIKFINSVADVVNNDKDIGDVLKVVFIPDYCVSAAEVIVPASDISQHISTAGTEASGTSNMKFVMNGGLILGTVDGANVEIAEEVGDDQIFMFGVLAHEVDEFRFNLRYHPDPLDANLQAVYDTIKSGVFGNPDEFNPLVECSHGPGDNYLVSVDFASYLMAQDAVDALYKDRESWITKSILCGSRMGKFTSDRSITDYAENIWNIEPSAVDA